jgi:uncharacterized damage-inducible protein DinB
MRVKTLRNLAVIASALVLMTGVTLAQASGSSKAATEGHATIASVLDNQLNNIEHEVMGAAEAIPEDKYDFSPATSNIPGDFKTPDPVRTISQQFKHIGDALEAYSSIILGEKPPTSNEENGPKNVKTKSDVISYLKGAFAKAHSAINTLTEQDATEEVSAGKRKVPRLALAVGMIGHSDNHYGQLIEYMRMNSIVPPESRPRPKS